MNDNPPTFDQEGGVILTMNPFEKIVGAVKAKDLDVTSTIRYGIVLNPEDDSMQFHIDPENGSISALDDFSKFRRNQFGFDVQATDGIFNSITNVLVKILKN